MSIKTQVPVIYTKEKCTTDDELQLIREMGIDCVDLNFGYEFCNESDLASYGLYAGNLSCMHASAEKQDDHSRMGRKR